MNKTLYNLYIKTTKEDKPKVYAIHISGEMQPNKTCRNNEKYVISLLLFVIHVYIDIVHIC